MTVESAGDDAAFVTPPSFRRDMTREIDVVEEIGRIHGYDSVPEDRVIPMTVARQRPFDRVCRKLRDLLCAMGYFEAVTFSFTDSAKLGLLRPWTQAEPLRVSHSSRRQENALRQSLLPSLLQCLSTNEARGNTGAALFEIAHLYWPNGEGQLPTEPSALGIASSADLRLVRGHVERLLDGLRIQAKFQPCDVAGFQPGQAGEYLLDGKRIGVLGVLAEKARDALELREPAVVAELLVDALGAAAHQATKTAPIPDHPSVVRDLAIVLDEQARWSALEEIVRSSAGEFLEDLEFVDLYRGKQVPEGKKSIAFRLTYRAPGRTLTREEVDVWQQRIIDELARKLGGQLRA
jgi:phenylalanyl-tRNA synthetase beta chain